jgi:hypothetical protein
VLLYIGTMREVPGDPVGSKSNLPLRGSVVSRLLFFSSDRLLVLTGLQGALLHGDSRHLALPDLCRQLTVRGAGAMCRPTSCSLFPCSLLTFGSSSIRATASQRRTVRRCRRPSPSRRYLIITLSSYSSPDPHVTLILITHHSSPNHHLILSQDDLSSDSELEEEVVRLPRSKQQQAKDQVGFPPLFLRFSIGKCRNCPLFSCILIRNEGKTGQESPDPHGTVDR